MNTIKGKLVSGRETIITTRIKDGEVHQTCGFNEGSLTPQEREELVEAMANALAQDLTKDESIVKAMVALDALLGRYELRRKI